MKKFFTLLASVALGMSMTVSAWNVPDETLQYDVHFKWGFISANAGVATLSTQNLPGTNQFRATLTGRSVDLLGHYYSVGDTMVGTIMSDTMQPVYTQYLSQESGEFSIETISYDTSGPSSEGNIVKQLPDGKVLRSRVSHYGGGLTLDLLAVFYYIRQIDYPAMTPGQQVKVNIFSGSNPETLVVTYNGQSSIDTDNGPQQVYQISLTFSAENGGQTNSDNMNVSISTGDARIPLYINGSLKVGHLVCRYIGSQAD
ncbi:MAG: DUF3108 domain-containing protein [Muribaculaceae bacterium]|nr:DUF3108 domain-containing protein [Muribaculaceae bacterium]